MKIELKESFPVDIKSEEFHKILSQFITDKDGKIQSWSDNKIKAKFGNILVARLFGIWLISMLWKNKLPFILEAELHDKKINMSFVDNPGPLLLYKDKWSISIFRSLFKELFAEIRALFSKSM